MPRALRGRAMACRAALPGHAHADALASGRVPGLMLEAAVMQLLASNLDLAASPRMQAGSSLCLSPPQPMRLARQRCSSLKPAGLKFQVLHLGLESTRFIYRHAPLPLSFSLAAVADKRCSLGRI